MFSHADPSHKHKGFSYKSIYSFKGGSDASEPAAGLVALGGKLYGTTFYGGAYGGGAVFVISSGHEKVIHDFGNGSDGKYPTASLVAYNGALYGTTSSGGANGFGTVFAMSTAGTEQWVYSFSNTPDAVQPEAGLVVLNGTLYGTSEDGGANGNGAVYQVSTSGVESVLYSFNYVSATDPYNPVANLTVANGALYGTGFYGGASNLGGVFGVTTTGTEQVLYSFLGVGQTDGALPTAALTFASGTFFGTTSSGGAAASLCPSTFSNGCGTVFSVDGSGTEHVLHSFGVQHTDGQVPDAPLIAVHGELYGTTENGGAIGSGTIFEISPSGKEKVLYSFRGGNTDGATPQAGLVELGGKFYGTTHDGGPSGDGTVYQVTL